MDFFFEKSYKDPNKNSVQTGCAKYKHNCVKEGQLLSNNFISLM